MSTLFRSGVIAGMIGLASLVIGSSAPTIPVEVQHYDHWFSQHLTTAPGIQFTHPAKPSRPLSPPERASLEGLFREKVKDKFGEERAFTLVESGEEYSFRHADISSKELMEYCSFVNSTVKEFLSTLGMEPITVSCHLLSPDTLVRSPSETDIPLYLIQNYLPQQYGLFAVEGMPKPVRLEIKDLGASSLTSVSLSFRVSNGKPELVQRDEMLLVSFNNGSLGAISGACAEVLHYRTSPIVREQATREFEREWGRTLSPQKIRKQWNDEARAKSMYVPDIVEIINEHIARNEGVVHALVDDFLEQHRNSLGISSDTLERYRNNRGHQYRHVGAVRKVIASLGAPKVFSLYQHRPETLFP